MTRITATCLIAFSSLHLLAACPDRTATRDSVATTVRADTAARAFAKTPPDKAAILTAAKADYTYEDPARGPVPALNADSIPNSGIKPGDAPVTITVAKATRKTVVVMPKDEVLARITSDKEYRPLGIIAGDNYVWRDRSDPDSTKWIVYLVPDDATTKEKKWKRDKREYSKGSHTQPRLVTGSKKRLAFVMGVCLEDPVCSTGHCGYGDLDSM